MDDALALAAGAQELALYELLRQRLVRAVPIPPPVAGAELTFAVPNGVVWELLSAAYKLTTSAVVANRRSSLRVSDPNGLLLGQMDSAAVQAASLAGVYTFQQELGSPVAAVVNAAPIPMQGVPLVPGTVIATSTLLIDVADQYANGVLMVREWSLAATESSLEWLAQLLR